MVKSESTTGQAPTFIENWLGRIASFAIALIIAIAGIIYSDLKTRVATAEDKISFLYQDKVSRAEFREEMTQLRLQNDANKTDIIARVESSKADTLARFDLMIPHITKKGQ